MALTQKIYLGTHPVEKRYLGEHPIKIQLAEFGVIGDGLTYYFNSKFDANVTEWPATISDRTGSYVTAATYYNSVERVVELDGGAAAVPSLSFGSSPITGNTAHSVLIFTKPKREAAKQVMEFQGDVGGTNDRTLLELRNDVDSTNYFVWRNTSDNITYYASDFGEVSLNEWHMFGYAYDAATPEPKVNTFYDASSSPVTQSGVAVDVGNLYWEAGSEGGSTTTDYSGSMGAVLVYNRKITAEEAETNYRALSGLFG